MRENPIAEDETEAQAIMVGRVDLPQQAPNGMLAGFDLVSWPQALETILVNSNYTDIEQHRIAILGDQTEDRRSVVLKKQNVTGRHRSCFLYLPE